MKQPEVSVVILTRNSERVLPVLLFALRAQRVSFQFELIFLDNSSIDRTVEIINGIDFCPKKLINIPEGEFSHSRTRMLALQHANGEVLVFFTDDIQPQGEDFLERLTRPVRERLAAAAYGVYQISFKQDPLENYLHNSWYQSYEDFSEPISEYCWRILPPQMRRRVINFDNCCSCIRKETLRSFPFPDVPYGEDMVFAKRLILNGQRIALVKEAKFFHWHYATFNYTLKRMCIDADLSWKELQLKFVSAYNQVLRSVLKRIAQRTFLILFKIRLNPFKKIKLIFYHARLLFADFLGKFMGGLQKEESSRWKLGYGFFFRKKEEIISSINQRSIHRPQKKEVSSTD